MKNVKGKYVHNIQTGSKFACFDDDQFIKDEKDFSKQEN